MRMLFTYVAVLLAATTARAEDDIGRVSYTGPMTKPQPKPDNPYPRPPFTTQPHETQTDPKWADFMRRDLQDVV